MKLKTHVKPTGIKLLLYGLAVLIVVNLLSRFNVLNVTGIQPDVITILAILFVATEIGVMAGIRGKKKLDGIGWFGTVVVILASIALIFGWLGMSLGVIAPFKGMIEIFLLIFVLVEIFR